MSTFVEQISAALDTSDAQEAGRRVHQVVAQELRSLDPTVTTDITGYFNHSYVPDLVMQWGNGREAFERPVFLRHSLRSGRASGDLADFDRNDLTAFYLSLALEEPEEETQRVRARAREHRESRVLVTTVAALDDLTPTTAAPDPVLGLVRSSIVRSAKGAILGSDVENLVLPRDRRITQAELDAFSGTVSSVFTEDAVLRINRVFGIVEQALADEPSLEALLLSGRLSETEIRELVPYLLSLEGVTRDRDFWVAVAQLIDLAEIERMWNRFADLDLTPLASAASGLWRAKRVLVNARSEAIDDEVFDRTPRWSVTGNLLSAEVGNWRLTFANKAQKLKTANRGLTPARWDDLLPSLQTYTVTAVDLRGVTTRSQYGAQESTQDMKQRIAAFIETADDSFHLPSVTVATGVGDERSEITADFTEMMLDAQPDTDLATLTYTALTILGYRYPTDETDVTALLAGTPLSEDEADEL
ncbi:hypothetical protein [Blastococcus saxobsidens]|uniref:Uncharacterized protein n=1 Tax=Blastococcus saxobsidens TaxID=138336 RepID=A0A4Q7Y263_9ACTN|nr:hypothetical protein [Blastococcus saxobsidens]RZU30880.1 hypothetical protein BKA19_0512 [Blastococcus saxobsidens]